LGDGSRYAIDWRWRHSVVAEMSSFEISPFAVEVVHRKASGATWGALEAAQGPVASAPRVERSNVRSDGATAAYPTSSRTKRDWDELSVAAGKEEKEDNKDGPGALHGLFREIYAGGDENMRRAMVKS